MRRMSFSLTTVAVEIKRRIDRLFAMEAMSGDGLCPIYLYRWTLLRVGTLLSIYLHKFVGDDWAGDFHDHPKRFISIGLRGRYFEHAEIECERDGKKCVDVAITTWQAPWLRTFAATHRHRITGPTQTSPCWTIVIVGKPSREWGFWPRGKFVPWRQYIRSVDARERRSCP